VKSRLRITADDCQESTLTMPKWPVSQKTLAVHLAKMGYGRVPEALRREIVKRILSTQDDKPFFWIEGRLPLCWNDSKDWDKITSNISGDTSIRKTASRMEAAKLKTFV
jgi:hypothetical protein